MREINKIILHCSDSEWGDKDVIDLWHKARGFTKIGYHFVILNGQPASGSVYNAKFDGVIEIGRGVEEVGAHCLGQNKDSIGICLIGKHHFTAVQLYEALPALVHNLVVAYKLTTSQVYGHYEFTPEKTCPNIDMKLLTRSLRVL